MPTQKRQVGLYSLREADRSVRIGAFLFLLVLGYSYFFAFLMVREFAGLTPGDVQSTYAPDELSTADLPDQSTDRVEPLDLGDMPEMKHRVDTRLLIQDSHIHILMFSVVAALLTLIVLGLEWPAWWRDVVIVCAFGSGALDFSGQWLMKAGLSGFAWLTLTSGWLMTLVYVVVLIGTARAIFFRRRAA